jgi:hypothetical protein
VAPEVRYNLTDALARAPREEDAGAPPTTPPPAE